MKYIIIIYFILILYFLFHIIIYYISYLSNLYVFVSEAPPPPANVSSGEIKETQFTLNWDPPKFSELFSIHSYLISYRAGNASNFQTKKIIISNKLNAKLDNLESDTFYEIYIRGKNEHGEGENSKSIKVKTAKAKGKYIRPVYMANKKNKYVNVKISKHSNDFFFCNRLLLLGIF